MSDLPRIAQRHSYKIEVEEGKKYAWCACGLSQSQPFCDGSHKGTGFSPVTYTADASKLVKFCGCKHSKLGPICDHTHRELPE